MANPSAKKLIGNRRSQTKPIFFLIKKSFCCKNLSFFYNTEKNLREKMNKKFTLLELLIVIAIIGILVTLLLPSLRSAREKAKIAVEVSNRAQLMKATIIYADDNSSWLPDRYNTFQELHAMSVSGKNDNNVRLLEAYCGSKEYDTREAMFFCDSTLNEKRNQQKTGNPDYSYDNGTVQYNNPPSSGNTIILDFDIRNLSFGEPENAVWNCMSLLIRSQSLYFGHDTPIITAGFQKGASTSFFDGSARWMDKSLLKQFYIGNDNTFYIPIK
jgi:prepilin-type N-terminal cleavage/methylation domain-containing protein